MPKIVFPDTNTSLSVFVHTMDVLLKYLKTELKDSALEKEKSSKNCVNLKCPTF